MPEESEQTENKPEDVASDVADFADFANSVDAKEAPNSKAPKEAPFPPWVKRIGKMMIIFAILGCILLSLGAFLLNHVFESVLSKYGL